MRGAAADGAQQACRAVLHRDAPQGAAFPCTLSLIQAPPTPTLLQPFLLCALPGCRLEDEPCAAGPGLGCAAGLACDLNSTMTCIQPVAQDEHCWPSRPCQGSMTCEPSDSKCYPTPRQAGQPCGPGANQKCAAAAGLVCHPQYKVRGSAAAATALYCTGTVPVQRGGGPQAPAEPPCGTQPHQAVHDGQRGPAAGRC